MGNITTKLNLGHFADYRIWRHLSTTDKKGDIIFGKNLATESKYMAIMPIYS
jgi:hypothetical protein